MRIRIQYTEDSEYQDYWNSKRQDSTYITPGIYTCKMYAILQNQLTAVFKDSIYMRFQSITGVRENASVVHPSYFRLNQNYPNPFNPSTTISFNIPTKSFVTMKVYNNLGREVATIISEEMSAGSYSKQWNASALSSGIYFYRLHAGFFTETKKLVLLK